MEQHITVDMDAAPERVWAVLTDIERWPEWTQTVNAVTRLDEGPLTVGSKARVEQPKLPPTEYVVTEFDPPRSFTWVATGPGIKTTAGHVLDSTASGTRLRLSVEQSGPVGEVMGRVLFRKLTSRYLAAEAAGLKARAES